MQRLMPRLMLLAPPPLLRMLQLMPRRLPLASPLRWMPQLLPLLLLHGSLCGGFCS